MRDTGAKNRDKATSRESEDARRRVVTALECLERSERDALEGLQHALCGYVSSLRADGYTAEEATALVTRLVGSPATQDGGLVVIPAVRSALVELAVGWCVSEYGRLEKSDAERANGPGAKPGSETTPTPPPA